MENTIVIRPLVDTDYELFKTWLYKAHVLKWYHDTEDWLKEVRERSREFSFLHHFIVYKGDEPIGFCQYYDCFDAKELWYAHSQAQLQFAQANTRPKIAIELVCLPTLFCRR